MQILLIEPDKILSRTYTAALEREGHTVVTTASAQAAIHLADTKTPDVIVLELQLPYHNGVEFLYEFRSYHEWLHIPIIVQTFVPLSEFDHIPTFPKELGVTRRLYKPITSLQQLCQAVNAAVTAKI